MRIIPILFNTDMVRALLEERKSVTRRVVKFPVGMTGRLPPSGARDYLYYPGGIMRSPYEYGDILYVRETWCNVNKPEYEPEYYYFADTKYVEDYCPSEWKWRPSIHMPKEAARIFLKVKSTRAERLQESFFTIISPIFELLAEGMDIGDDCRECIATYGNPCCVDTVDEDGSNLYGGDCGILDEIRGKYSELWDRLYAKPMPVKKHGKVVRYESYPWSDIHETRTYRGKPWLVIGNPWVWVIEFERVEKPAGWPGEER